VTPELALALYLATFAVGALNWLLRRLGFGGVL
jgi:hypothetical protein